MTSFGSLRKSGEKLRSRLTGGWISTGTLGKENGVGGDMLGGVPDFGRLWWGSLTKVEQEDRLEGDETFSVLTLLRLRGEGDVGPSKDCLKGLRRMLELAVATIMSAKLGVPTTALGLGFGGDNGVFGGRLDLECEWGTGTG